MAGIWRKLVKNASEVVLRDGHLWCQIVARIVPDAELGTVPVHARDRAGLPAAGGIQPHMRRSLAPISTGSRWGAVARPAPAWAGGHVQLWKCRKLAAGMKRVREA